MTSDPTRARKIWIVLPAYNEEKDLGVLFDRIDEAMEEVRLQFEVVLVDDGSTDSTLEIVERWSNKLPMRTVRHAVNLGLGATIRDGLKAACESAGPKDVIVTLDADNSHTPELILRMVRSVREGNDVVIASRFQSGSRVRGVPLHRRLLSRLAGALLKVTFPIRGVRDYTCGYRAYRATVLQDVTASDPDFFDQDGFQVVVDILLKLRRNRDLVFGEVPLILRYDLKTGASKMDIGATALNTLRLIVRRRLG